MRALEDLVTSLAQARPTDGSLAVLKRLLATLGQRRRLRLEALVLHVAIIGANLAAGVRLSLGVDGHGLAQVLAAWLAVLALSALAFLRVAGIRSHLRSLSERVDELVALLRWIYR